MFLIYELFKIILYAFCISILSYYNHAFPSLSQIPDRLHPWLRCTIRQDGLHHLDAFAAETEEL